MGWLHSSRCSLCEETRWPHNEVHPALHLVSVDSGALWWLSGEQRVKKKRHYVDTTNLRDGLCTAFKRHIKIVSVKSLKQ